MEGFGGHEPFVTAQRILQGKWAFLILHNLCGGPLRFNELQREIDISQATLSTQLKGLEKDGMICRTVYPEVPVRVEYSLSEQGTAFIPVLREIEKWEKNYLASGERKVK